MGLPDFLVIGAPKAGTTALHAALAKHPDLYLSPVKEPKFFLCDDAPPRRSSQRGPGDAHSAREWVWQRRAYERLFDGAPAGALRGESTPFYLWDRDAHRRIADAVPAAKLIAIVRDPVDRAYSNWTHLWSDGLEPCGDFLEAVAREHERAERGWAPFWRYLGLGRYGEQLEHLYRHVPREQVHVLRYRDLVDEPSATLDRICTFLGVRTGAITLAPSENVSTFVADSPANAVLRTAVRAGAAAGSLFPPRVWRRASVPVLALLKRDGVNRPDLTEAQRGELIARMVDDIRLLEELTGQSFDDWRRYRTGGTYSVRTSFPPVDEVASK